MKPLPKLLLFVAVVGGSVAEIKHLVYTGVIPRPSLLKTLVPTKVEEINAAVLPTSADATAQQKNDWKLPSNRTIPPCVDGNTRNCLSGAVQEIEIWAWNANGGLIYSVGGGLGPNGAGIATSKDSLQAKRGVAVWLRRQDDTGQMKTDLLDFVSRYANDPAANGTKFVTLMGDGYAQFAHDLNPKLAKICADCTTEVVGVLGYSRGEDGFWGQKEWKDKPTAAKGALVLGVLRDGDWNIALKWMGQNKIPNNPDDTVYDPDAVNWVNEDSYTKAAEDYVAGKCVDLPIKGKLGGGKKHVCANGVVTWTPGDVTIAKKRGGLVPIMTTGQSVFQMPCVLVGIRRWDRAHRTEVANLLAGAFEGADEIRSLPGALDRMGEISQTLYRESGASAEYWVRYYKGVTEPDATGVNVHLGGSAVSNLADNLQAFGMSGGPSLFAATYTSFGRIVVEQYPTLYPDFPDVTQIVDVSYIRAVEGSNSLPTTNGEKVITTTTAPMKSIEGKRDYTINFATGSDQILPSSRGTLDQLAQEIEITNYIVAAHGHTDNTGTPDANQNLSERRAASVIEYLKAQGVRNTVRAYGHGQEDPIASNNTAEGRAKNRRVQIVLGTAN